MTNKQKKPNLYSPKQNASVYEEDLFYYNGKSDEDEALAVLGYTTKNESEDDLRVRKFW